MQYVKGEPYFYKCSKHLKQYPYLDKDIETEILIVGGGICGAILNYFLSQKHNVTLIDKGRLGGGCTSCATAILEYQLDDFYSQLKQELTSNEIIQIYKMGIKCIKKIENFTKKHNNLCEFYKRPSFFYTTKESDKKLFKKEFELRTKNGLKCELITKNNNPFTFDVAYGLYCKDGGAEINPYLFAKQLFENSKNQNNIFENTNYEYMEQNDKNITIFTNYNHKITCKYVIFATGFNYEQFDNNKLSNRFITFSIVTNPLKNFEWKNRATIHDNTKPYHYLRLLPDNRIIFGGEDIPYNNVNFTEKTANSKYKKLFSNLVKLFPSIKDQIKVEYKFCGAFAQTDNNLGLIGQTDKNNVFYFLSCGANGIVNAMYGVELIEHIFNHKQDKLEHLFTPLRILNS